MMEITLCGTHRITWKFISDYFLITSPVYSTPKSQNIILTCLGSRLCPWLLLFWSWGNELGGSLGTFPVLQKVQQQSGSCFYKSTSPSRGETETSNLQRVCALLFTCCRRVSCWATCWALCSFWLKGSRSSLCRQTTERSSTKEL